MPRPIVSRHQIKLAGEFRRSQILTSYGSGALVDFPRLSGIMAGLESWPIQKLPESAKIRERNLEIMLGKEFFYQVSSPENDFDKTFSLPAYRFPSWYYCPECHRLDRYNKIAKPTSNNTNEYNSSLVCNNCSDATKQVKLIPSRFVFLMSGGHTGQKESVKALKCDLNTEEPQAVWTAFICIVKHAGNIQRWLVAWTKKH